MEANWEFMCRDQHDEIAKLRLHISQLEHLLHPNDDDDASSSINDENSSSNISPPVRPYERRSSTSSSGQCHGADESKWRERVVVERQTIERAMELVARQKRDLRSQTHKLKAEKEAWRQEHMTGQSSVVLKEMKRILDSNTATLNQSIRQLRATEQRLHTRTDKLDHIEHMMRRRTLDGDCYTNPFSEQDSFSMESDDNESLVSMDSMSISEALHGLFDDLRKDAASPPAAIFRDESMLFPHFAREAPPSSNMWHGERFWPHRAYPIPATSTLPAGGLRELQCASIYEKQIAKWVHGRRRVQQAAIQHAKWLTSLCDELHEYSKIYDTTDHTTAGAPSFASDDLMDAFP